MITAVTNTSRKILVVPFSWGLGHASRLIPVIRYLRSEGAKVILGGGPDQLELLRQEFPELECIPFPWIRIRLSQANSQILTLALQVPGIFLQIFREHRFLVRTIRRIRPDAVLSDNCYGLWNKRIKSVFITHQLWIRLPNRIRFLEKFLNTLNHYFISRFDACWVPDLPEEPGLAGSLSHPVPELSGTRYIGLLSRFLYEEEVSESGGNKRILVIISGPEHQRSLFERKIGELLEDLPPDLEYKLIRGLPDSGERSRKYWFNHMDSHALAQSIREADYIICRAGYSSIMDLIAFGKSALLVPTPGQTEQEYLACHLSNSGLFRCCSQNDLRLENLLSPNGSIPASEDLRKRSSRLFETTLDEFLKSLDS